MRRKKPINTGDVLFKGTRQRLASLSHFLDLFGNHCLYGSSAPGKLAEIIIKHLRDGTTSIREFLNLTRDHIVDVGDVSLQGA